jgi:adenylate cyclase
MNPFSQYTNIIEKALNSNAKVNFNEINKSLSYQQTKTFSYNEFLNLKSNLEISNELIEIANAMQAKPILNQVIGQHPDFIHLKNTNNTENHYIVSAFIDIKGSTNLFRRYDNETVKIITDTIQLSAISVCKVFGGFVHRLQGDGLFVYFGGKNVLKNLAVEHSLTALSFFTYFVKNDLKRVFEQKGIENIFTKIGVDFGDDKDVLWGMAGVENTSEITTCSLHTSLASKMQTYAKSNEIIVGQNIKSKSNIQEDHFSIINEESRYIFRNPDVNFNYTQYQFNWLKYLKSLQQLAVSMNGNIEFRKPNQNLSTGANFAPLLEVASKNIPWGY